MDRDAWASCGSPVQGTYCGQCGERRVAAALIVSCFPTVLAYRYLLFWLSHWSAA